MTSLVPNIVEVLMSIIALGISNRGNDWTAESAMISSNDINLSQEFLHDKSCYQIENIIITNVCNYWCGMTPHLLNGFWM